VALSFTMVGLMLVQGAVLSFTAGVPMWGLAAPSYTAAQLLLDRTGE
jgi:hypothetical protein